jgi:hypothetical protein
MQEIRSYEKLIRQIAGCPYLMVFLSSQDCSVCAADFIHAEKLADRLGFPAVSVEIGRVPQAAGQLNVFTAPAVLLFHRGREYHRQARFLDFAQLQKHMEELRAETE